MTARARIPPELAVAWRFAALAGLAGGLAAAPVLGPPAGGSELVAGSVAGGAGLVLAAPGRGDRSAGAWCGVVAITWLALVGLVGCVAGLAIGSARVAAIDGGALGLAPGARVEVEGFVTAPPRRRDGQVRVRVQTPAGRLLVEAPEPVADLDVGAPISASGTIRAPTEFERAYLERLGVKRVLRTRAITVQEGGRGGLVGAVDRIRLRAQRALSSGTPEASSALLRGFVLGQDDRIAERTADEFKRSGLAHLLAVSGQNVVLLALLAVAVLAVLGVGVRARLLCVLALIGVYVLVTGAGPSIQRAGVMGAAGVIAALAGRPRSRWYAVLLAAAVTLVLDPRASADVGWQLSFAAVVGILLLSAPLARALAGPVPGSARRAIAEAAALTASATLATAPLMSFHFGTVSLVALPANLVAVVAEAPVMWLGMLAAAAGQLDWMPVEPVTWAAGLLAAYIAQVAEWFSAPDWAQVDLGLPGPAALVAAYTALGGFAIVGLGWARRRRRLRPAPGGRPPRRLRIAVPATAAIAVLVTAPVTSTTPSAGGAAPAPGLRVRVLDVGQGDSILLEPAAGAPVLVDAGPTDAGVADRLAGLGVDRLAALLLTHPDADHSGGAAEVLGSVAVEHLLFARVPATIRGAGAAAGVRPDRVAAGSTLRSGALRLRVLWPPRVAGRGPAGGGEPNALSVVALARWHRFRLLLSGDAEAELAPVHPGDVDVLKVAHHGSADTGLPSLLAEAEPELALISVGGDNPYGHPAPETLAALTEAGVGVLRTDLDGEITLDVGRRGWSARAG